MDLYKFSKNRFCGDRWGVCSFLRRIRPSGSGPKINFTKNFGPGQADPDRGGCRDPGHRYRQPASSPRDNGFSVLRIFLTAARMASRKPRVRRPGNLE